MIDNVYELKQRFVGFNKVKLLTVVFYCMTYSWCSFLTEYNAMEDQEEHKENEIMLIVIASMMMNVSIYDSFYNLGKFFRM